MGQPREKHRQSFAFGVLRNIHLFIHIWNMVCFYSKWTFAGESFKIRRSISWILQSKRLPHIQSCRIFDRRKLESRRVRLKLWTSVLLLLLHSEKVRSDDREMKFILRSLKMNAVYSLTSLSKPIKLNPANSETGLSRNNEGLDLQ